MHVDLKALPHLREVFDRLRSGRHLCIEDGALFIDLRANLESYKAIFRGIGFELVAHPREFYYFQSDVDLSKEAAQLAVFFFILIEFWSDEGADLEATAFSPSGHQGSQLPHFNRDSWASCMRDAGVEGEEALPDLLRKIQRYGFIELSGDTIRFRAPAWRFFDMCSDIAADRDDASGPP